ncbi:iron-sulfur cluster assembly scaffold protein [Elusimicrobiota bacterium]
MALYCQQVMEHFTNPRNMGEIENADGIGEAEHPSDGDLITLNIKVSEGKLSDVKFRAYGCANTIAVASSVTEMAIGKTLDEARGITASSVAQKFGGLPEDKMHCAGVGAAALHDAIDNYLDKQGHV